MNRFLLSAFAVAGLLNSAAADEPLTDMLEARTYRDADGKTLPYRLLKPASVEDGKKYPLVLFLHGAGERGDNNEAQLKHGVGRFARPEAREKFPCILIAPQCPQDQSWASIRRGNSGPSAEGGDKPTEPGRLALEIVDQIMKEFPIDPDRVYITGLSMGGFGTWDLTTRNPDKFAAAVPVCGGGVPDRAERIARVPIWAFHGARDNVVPPERSRDMVAALWKAGAHPGYTEYPDTGHDSWTAAYSDPQLFDWLFKQKRSESGARDR